ncbi:MAG: cupin domain-containing protein [Acidobacteriaceae bacterium]
MRLRFLLMCAAVCLCAVINATGQDAAKVDPKHYKVEIDNPQVRVVRIHYGPHERSVMHSHPNSVVVYLTDGKIRMHLPDGKTQDASAKKGATAYLPASVHDPENIGDQPFELIQVELKSPKATGAVAKKQ